MDTSIAPPVSLIDRIRRIEPGASELFEPASVSSVRAMMTRVKDDTGAKFTSRPEGKGVRIWRLA